MKVLYIDDYPSHPSHSALIGACVEAMATDAQVVLCESKATPVNRRAAERLLLTEPPIPVLEIKNPTPMPRESSYERAHAKQPWYRKMNKRRKW